MPGLRHGIDEMAERAPWRRRNAQEEARRESRRRTGIGLRLATIGERAVEHVRAEAGFGGVAPPPVAVAEKGTQPAVRIVSSVEIVNQLHMTELRLERTSCKRRHVERRAMIARQRAEAMLRHARAFCII